MMPYWLIIAISTLWAIHFIFCALSLSAQIIHNTDELAVMLRGRAYQKAHTMYLHIALIPFTIFWWSWVIFS